MPPAGRTLQANDLLLHHRVEGQGQGIKRGSSRGPWRELILKHPWQPPPPPHPSPPLEWPTLSHTHTHTLAVGCNMWESVRRRENEVMTKKKPMRTRGEGSHLMSYWHFQRGHAEQLDWRNIRLPWLFSISNQQKKCSKHWRAHTRQKEGMRFHLEKKLGEDQVAKNPMTDESIMKSWTAQEERINRMSGCARIFFF